MRLKLRCLLTGCLLISVAACASNNSANPPTDSAATATNSAAGLPAPAQPPSGVANEAGAPSSTANQPTTPAAAGIDACSLLTSQEVAAIQGGAFKDTKGSQRTDGDFLMSQCFYTAEEFVRSVSLSVVQPNPAAPTKQPKDFFTEKFRDAVKKPEREKEQKSKEANQQARAGGEEEEKKEEPTVERISGLGDQAYWVQGGPSAALYVLKKNQFLILSLGGGDADPVKRKKTQELAKQALKRLK